MNSRSAQLLTAGLGFVLVVLVGAVLFILLNRPAQGPRVSPSPSAVANVSPSASPFPSFSFSPFPTFSQLPTTSPSASAPFTLPPTAVITLPPPTLPPTPSPTPSPTPTPTAPPIPTAPGREIRVTDLGLDPRNLTGGVERFLLFTTDGPSVVRAEISGATARSRVCLWQGTDVINRQCETLRNGAMEWPVFGPGQVAWTLSLIGANETTAPTVDIALAFNADAPSVEFQNLHYAGPSNPAYNGLTWAVDPGQGTFAISGAFEPTQQQSYHVVVQEAGVGVVRDEQVDDVETFSVTQEVTAETSYFVSVTNPNELEGSTPVLLRLTTSWR